VGIFLFTFDYHKGEPATNLKLNPMKNRKVLVGVVLLITLFVFHSCKKEKGEVPTLTTSDVTNITGTSATCGGTITDEGSGTIVERGVCWSKGITPTTIDSRTIEGGGAGSFLSNMINLDVTTTYYVRAYAVNEAGVGYGMVMSFTTQGQVPTATTQTATGVTSTTAILHGIINPNYLSTIVTFEYGITTGYGQTIPATQSPATGNSNTNVTAELSGLLPGTTYHFRIKTINSLGTTYGSDFSFTTLGQVPTATTQPATGVTSTTAILHGVINPNYLSTIVTFEYGTTTNYGQTITTTQSPITGNSNTNVTAELSGLLPETIYHFRIETINSLGTTYGSDFSFTTLPPTITDIDGNVYNITAIGTQVWMKENLKVTKYCNGDLIGTTAPATSSFTGEAEFQWSYNEAITEFSNSLAPLISGGAGNLSFDQMVKAGIIKQSKRISYENQISALGIPYNSNMTASEVSNTCDSISASIPEVYGRLYTWYAIVDIRNVCPTGWHIPTDTEWATLISYLGGDASAGGKLKESGSLHWNSPNTGATNESGFNALPAGWRKIFGGDSFMEFGIYGYWWSSTEVNPTNALYRAIHYDSGAILRNNFDKRSGFSVRCLKY